MCLIRYNFGRRVVGAVDSRLLEEGELVMMCRNGDLT